LRKSLGKGIAHYRTIAILFGSILCGMCGSLWVFYSGAIPPSLARYGWTFLPWLMLLLGGSNRGSFVGAFVLVALNKLIVYYKYVFVGILPFDVVWLNYILLGLVTVIILIYRPQGITRDKRTVPRDILRLAQKELGPSKGRDL
jgi:branched-chain amino acid transport system permease protein